MGIPKFASLIRTKYRSCWNNPGDIRYDRSARTFKTKNESMNFRHLLIDGNSLLHMAFQFTFGYGGKVKMTPEHQKFLQTSTYDEIFDQAVKNFCNSIDNMIETLHLEGYVFLVFDGSAPVSKMVQQRQRRFGKYYSVKDDPVFQTALKKEMNELISGMGHPPEADSESAEQMLLLERQAAMMKQIKANRLGRPDKVTIELPPVLEDVANRPFPRGGEFYVKELAGGDSHQVMELLVNWSRGSRSGNMRRWTNVLNPNAPHTVEVEIPREGRKRFLCAKHAAIYMIYKEDNPGDVLLDGLVLPAEMTDTERKQIDQYRIYFEVDGFQIPSTESIFNGSFFRIMDIFEKNNHNYMRVNSSRINSAVYKVMDELSLQNSLFKETLIRTGDSILMSNGRPLHFLMAIRQKTVAEERHRRIYGQEEDMGVVLDRLIQNTRASSTEPTEPVNGPTEPTEPVNGQTEAGYATEDIYFAEEDDQTHHNSKTFDSNCLTPGTKEMERIADSIKDHYRMFFADKGPCELRRIDMGTYIPQNGRQTVEVVFSDSNTPGEGEQKLMQLFRAKNFQNPQRGDMDLFYGLDADLFVLTIIRQTMFPNYRCGLLREEEVLRTNFVPPSRRTASYAERGLTYHVADMAKLTKMIAGTIHPFDFCFLTFLFGNDFIPRSPIMSYENSVFEKAIQVVDSKETSKLLQVVNHTVEIQWVEIKRLLDQLERVEKTTVEGLYKMFDKEKRIRESDRTKTLENLKRELVPLRLKYDMVLRSTSVTQIWKTRGIDETVKRVTNIDYRKFREEWEQHIASGMPGYRNGRLSTLKEEVSHHACDEYLAGLNWVACYYFNDLGEEEVNDVHGAENIEYVARYHARVGHYEGMTVLREYETRDQKSARGLPSVSQSNRPYDTSIEVRAVDFVRSHLDLDSNAASNDRNLTTRCCWDTSVYADLAIINTVPATSPYDHGTTRYTVAVDMIKEADHWAENVYVDSRDYVVDLDYAIGSISQDNHYGKIYILVQRDHPDEVFAFKPVVVAENEEFRLLRFIPRPRKRIPDNFGEGRLNPFWYYPYLSSPMMATLADRLTDIGAGNMQSHVNRKVKGNRLSILGSEFESLWAVSPSVQCYGVLPPQSSSLYPAPLRENEAANWQFPVKVTHRDYNFKGWVHEGALSVPYLDVQNLTDSGYF